MNSEEDNRLIEDFIPIREIGLSGAMEKKNRFDNISGLHIWWARKPVTVSRSIIFLSLTNKMIKKEKNDLVRLSYEWDTNNCLPKLELLRKAIKNSVGKQPKLLDCFSGGGSIPLEALRLNCDTYAVDINPVSYIILQSTIVIPEKYNSPSSLEPNKLIADFEKYANCMKNLLVKEVETYYPSGNGLPVAYVWARTVRCSNPQCGVDIPLVTNLWLAKDVAKEYALRLIPSKKKIEIKIESTKFDFDPDEGTVKRGSCVCPVCNQTTSDDYIKNFSKKNGFGKRLLAVIKTKDSRSKIYLLPDEREIAAFDRSIKKLSEYENKMIGTTTLIPNENLPTNTQYSGPYVYGITKWRELFNERQLLMNIKMVEKLHYMYNLILDETNDRDHAKSIATLLAVLVDRLVDYNSSLCLLCSTGGRGVVHTFGRGALPMSWNYAESYPFNPLGANWDKASEVIIDIIKSVRYIQSTGKVTLGSATNLPYKNEFFDVVVTDPPYHDYIPYSDLSDFFYIWLKRSIGFLYPEAFSTMLTPKKEEIFERPLDDPYANKSFREKLFDSFKEIDRVLSKDGLFVLIFAHKTTSAWEDLIETLIKSNFIITASWPITTEKTNRLRAQDSAVLDSSITLVCRKRISEEDGYLNSIKEDLQNKVCEKLDQFWQNGVRGADFFISSIGPAVEIFGRYNKVRKLSGEEVSTGEFLNIVRQLVTDYSLRKILHNTSLGEIDEITRYYILWRWAYNNSEIVFDDARKLAQALGTESAQLISTKDILQKKGNKVKLLGPKERSKQKDLGEQKGGLPASMIDVIHKLCLLWENGNKKTLLDFLSNSGYKNSETLWGVAQALSEILCDGDKEKQLLQGLLASKSSTGNDRFKTQKTLSSFR